MLRRRLTIVFVLAVGVSAAALAAGSYFVVRHNLLADSVNDGARQARRNLVVAPTYLRQGSNALIQAYRRSGDLRPIIGRERPYWVCHLRTSALSAPRGFHHAGGGRLAHVIRRTRRGSGSDGA